MFCDEGFFFLIAGSGEEGRGRTAKTFQINLKGFLFFFPLLRFFHFGQRTGEIAYSHSPAASSPWQHRGFSNTEWLEQIPAPVQRGQSRPPWATRKLRSAPEFPCQRPRLLGQRAMAGGCSSEETSLCC